MPGEGRRGDEQITILTKEVVVRGHIRKLSSRLYRLPSYFDWLVLMSLLSFKYQCLTVLAVDCFCGTRQWCPLGFWTQHFPNSTAWCTPFEG